MLQSFGSSAEALSAHDHNAKYEMASDWSSCRIQSGMGAVMRSPAGRSCEGVNSPPHTDRTATIHWTIVFSFFIIVTVDSFSPTQLQLHMFCQTLMNLVFSEDFCRSLQSLRHTSSEGSRKVKLLSNKKTDRTECSENMSVTEFSAWSC